MKAEMHSATSPYTGVCLLVIPIQLRDPDNPKEYIELFRFELNLDTKGEAQFRTLPKEPVPLPGGKIDY